MGIRQQQRKWFAKTSRFLFLDQKTPEVRASGVFFVGQGFTDSIIDFQHLQISGRD